jgi:type I restriction enzyme S subunit
VTDGTHDSPKIQKEGVPFIKGKHISGGRIDFSICDFISEIDHKEACKRVKPRRGDILFSNIGSVGDTAVVKEDREFSIKNVALFRPDCNKVDRNYFYYLVLSPEFRSNVMNVRSGSAQPFISLANLRSFEVTYHENHIVQRRIANILSAYDDLIENNQRRIKILEEMARSLYREWFVHFRFPGHESHPRVASPLGEIPKGWEVCALGDFVQFKSGFAFKSGTFTAGGEHRLVTIKNVQDGSFNPESDSRMDELPKKMPLYCVLNNGDILLSLTGNVGRVCLVYDGPFLLNQRVSKLVPEEALDWTMTYCMFREPEMRLKLEKLSNGVAQQNLSPVLASQMEFACPPRELRQKFAVMAEPLARGIVQLYSKIQNLRRTRNLLLPRLLSGELAWTE